MKLDKYLILLTSTLAFWATGPMAQADPTPGDDVECLPGGGGGSIMTSADDATGPRYRKIGLNGFPLPDEKPQQKEESDQEPEETYIDAFNHNLTHQVTDIYVPMQGTDLTLTVRRNWAPEIWNMGAVLRPEDHRPDRPFGSGWSSSLNAGIQFELSAVASQPSTATVTDEGGATYRFLICPFTTSGTQFYPMPQTNHDQEVMATTLEVVSGTYIFKKKYGTKLTFSVNSYWANYTNWITPSSLLDSSATRPAFFWARLDKAEDRYGTQVNYTFSASNNGIIPDSISCRGKTIYVTTSSNRVTSITDPRGKTTSFGYGTYNAEGKLAGVADDFDQVASVLQTVTKPAVSGTSAVTTYTYSGTHEVEPTQINEVNQNWYYYLDLASIQDPNGNTYSFTYDFDHARQAYLASSDFVGWYSTAGNPRNVSWISLPDGSHVELANLSKVRLFQIFSTDPVQLVGQHKMTIKDANSGTWTYDFTDTEVSRLDQIQDLLTMEADPASTPFLCFYKTMTVTTPENGTLVAKFDPSAGMALTSLKDVTSGTDAATTFTHTDTFDYTLRTPWLDYGIVPSLPVQYWSDPTSQTNGEGQTKYFHYASGTAVKQWRIMDAVTDELGRYTTYTIDSLGRRTEEKIYASASGTTGTPEQETDFTYSSSFPGIMTQKKVKDLSGGTNDLITTYTLDGTNGNVLSETVGTGSTASVTQYTYDENNNKLSTTDPNGNTTSFVYDDVGHLVKTIFPSVTTFSGTSYSGTTVTTSGSKTLVYDPRGNKTQEIDENGNATLWAYDGLNRVIKQARDLNGNGVIDSGTTDIVTVTTYTPLNAKATIVSPTSGTSTMTYDGLNRLVSTTDALSHTTTLEYGANSGGLQFGKDFQPTKSTDARGFATLVTYDKNYRPIQKDAQYAWSGTTPVYSTTKTEYDAVGNVVKDYDPLSTTLSPLYTAKTYDALNRETLLVFTDSTTNHIYYTTTGLKYKVVDELGNDTLSDYDDHGRMIKVSSPVVDNGSGTNARAITETTYDLANNVVAVKNPLGYSTTTTYDARNRKASETRPGTGSPTTYWQYDKVGNTTKVTDALGNATVTQYDVANRPIKVTMPPVAVSGSGTSSPVTTKEYDQSGNITKVTDPNSHNTLNVYDKLNQLLTTTQVFSSTSDNITVTNEYDEVGNKITVKDGLNQETDFTYDGLKRNLTKVDEENNTTAFVYNAADKIERIAGDGGHTVYAYDKRHRVTQVSYKWSSTGAAINDGANPTRTYTYDGAGNLLAVSEPAKDYSLGEVAYTYDALKRILTETSNNVTHTYRYDLAGNRIFCAYGGISSGPAGWYLSSAYDEQNRLTSLGQVSTGTMATLATTYTYDLNGNILVKAMPNGDADTSTYDALNRTVSLVSTSGTNALSSYTYEFDPASNVKKVTEAYGNTALNRTVTNSYDKANRLTQEVTTGSSALTTDFEYDKANNRTKMTKGSVVTNYTYNDLNQLTQVSDGVTAHQRDFYYDLNGRRWYEFHGGTLTLPTDYFYNFENQLIGSKIESTGYLYNFIYDYRSRRVRKQIYTYTVPDPSSGLTNLFNNYVFSGGVEVRVLESTVPHEQNPSVDYVRGSDWGGGVGGILYSLRSGVPSFTHYNRRGDVTSKVSLSGSTTYQATYEAYGLRVTETGSTLDPQKSNTKDEDIPGYANEGMRFRDLSTGVFITPDPAGFIDGPNLYTYVKQNPWTAFDPEGLDDKTVNEATAILNSDPNTQAMGETSGQGGHVQAGVNKVAGGVVEAGNTLASLNPVQNAITAGTGKDALGGQVSKTEQGMAIGGIVVGAGGKVFAKIGGKLVELTKAVLNKLGIGGKTAKEIVEGTKDLKRPYIRKDVRAEVESRAPKTEDGKFIDPNTGEVIEGKYDLGHKPGNEFRTEKAKAEAEGLNQKEFNDKMNNPDLYQVENPSSNRSHKYEKKDTPPPEEKK